MYVNKHTLNINVGYKLPKNNSFQSLVFPFTLTIPTLLSQAIPGSIEAAITTMAYWQVSSTSIGTPAVSTPTSGPASFSHTKVSKILSSL